MESSNHLDVFFPFLEPNDQKLSSPAPPPRTSMLAREAASLSPDIKHREAWNTISQLNKDYQLTYPQIILFLGLSETVNTSFLGTYCCGSGLTQDKASKIAQACQEWANLSANEKETKYQAFVAQYGRAYKQETTTITKSVKTSKKTPKKHNKEEMVVVEEEEEEEEEVVVEEKEKDDPKQSSIQIKKTYQWRTIPVPVNQLPSEQEMVSILSALGAVFWRYRQSNKTNLFQDTTMDVENTSTVLNICSIPVSETSTVIPSTSIVYQISLQPFYDTMSHKLAYSSLKVRMVLNVLHALKYIEMIPCAQPIRMTAHWFAVLEFIQKPHEVMRKVLGICEEEEKTIENALVSYCQNNPSVLSQYMNDIATRMQLYGVPIEIPSQCTMFASPSGKRIVFQCTISKLSNVAGDKLLLYRKLLDIFLQIGMGFKTNSKGKIAIDHVHIEQMMNTDAVQQIIQAILHYISRKKNTPVPIGATAAITLESSKEITTPPTICEIYQRFRRSPVSPFVLLEQIRKVFESEGLLLENGDFIMKKNECIMCLQRQLQQEVPNPVTEEIIRQAIQDTLFLLIHFDFMKEQVNGIQKQTYLLRKTTMEKLQVDSMTILSELNHQIKTMTSTPKKPESITSPTKTNESLSSSSSSLWICAFCHVQNPFHQNLCRCCQELKSKLLSACSPFEQVLKECFHPLVVTPLFQMLQAMMDALRLYTESTISKDVLEQRVHDRIPSSQYSASCFHYAIALFWSDPSSVNDAQSQHPKYIVPKVSFPSKYIASIMYRSSNRFFLPPWFSSSTNELLQLLSTIPSLFLTARDPSASYKSIYGVTDFIQRCTMSFSQIAMMSSILFYLSHIPLDQDSVPCVQMICQDNEIIHDERQFSYIMEWRMNHTMIERLVKQPNWVNCIEIKLRQLVSEACIAFHWMVPSQTSVLQSIAQKRFFSMDPSEQQQQQQATQTKPDEPHQLIDGLLTNPGRPLCLPYAELGTCHHYTFARRMVDDQMKKGQITNDSIQKELNERCNIYLMDHVHIKQVSDTISQHVIHNTCMYVLTDGRRTCIERNQRCQRKHVLLFFHRLKNIIVEEPYSEQVVEQWKMDRTRQHMEYIMPSSSTSSSSSSSSSVQKQVPSIQLLTEPGRPLCMEWIQGQGKCRHSALFYRLKDKLHYESGELRKQIDPEKEWKQGDYVNPYRLDHPHPKVLRVILNQDSSEKFRCQSFCRYVVDATNSVCSRKGPGNCTFRHSLVFYDRTHHRIVHDDSKNVITWKTQIHEREDKYYSEKVFRELQQRDQQWDSYFFPTKQPFLQYQPHHSRSRSKSRSKSRSRASTRSRSRSSSPCQLPNIALLNEPGRPLCMEWMNRQGKCKHLVYFFRLSNKIRKDHGQKINSAEANRCWKRGDYINMYRLDHPHPEKFRNVTVQTKLPENQCWNTFANEYQYPDYDRKHDETTCTQNHSLVFYDYHQKQLVVDSSIPVQEWKTNLFRREQKYVSGPIVQDVDDDHEWVSYVYPTRSRSRSSDRRRNSPSRRRNRSLSPNEWTIRSP